MKIAIGADHAGYQLKDSLKKLLDEMGVAYQDFGTTSAQSVDYPDFAQAVAHGVAGGQFDRGILVCGTGVGMAIAANKVAGRPRRGDCRHRHREAVARAQRPERHRARRARAA